MVNDSIHLLPLIPDINVIIVNEFHIRVVLLHLLCTGKLHSLKRLPYAMSQFQVTMTNMITVFFLSYFPNFKSRNSGSCFIYAVR